MLDNDNDNDDDDDDYYKKETQIKQQLHDKYDPFTNVQNWTKLKLAEKKKKLDTWYIEGDIHLRKHSSIGNKKKEGDGVYRWAKVACFIANQDIVNPQLVELSEEFPECEGDLDSLLEIYVERGGIVHYMASDVRRVRCNLCKRWLDYQITNYQYHLKGMHIEYFSFHAPLEDKKAFCAAVPGYTLTSLVDLDYKDEMYIKMREMTEEYFENFSDEEGQNLYDKFKDIPKSFQDLAVNHQEVLHRFLVMHCTPMGISINRQSSAYMQNLISVCHILYIYIYYIYIMSHK